jgi:O-antigen/teichoic acid export membrane protein
MLRRRLTRNGLFKILGEAGSRGLWLVYFILLARWLGDDDFGRYAFALSYVGLFAAVVDMGINAIVTRDLARDRSRAEEVLLRANTLKWGGALCAVAAVAVSLPFLPHPPETKRLILLLSLFMAGTGLFEYLCAALSGLERMEWEASLKVLNRVLGLAGAGAGFYLTRSLDGVVVGVLAGFAVSLVAGYAILARLGARFGGVWDWPWQRRLLVESLPLWVSWFFWKLYENQNTVLLSFFRTPAEQIGWFAAALRLLDVTRGIPTLASGAVFPVLADLSKSDPEKFRRMGGFLLRWAVLTALPLAAGTTLLAAPLLRLVYGPEFVPAAAILSLCIWAALGIFVNNILLNLLIALDLQKKVWSGAAFVSLMNLAASAALIPTFGARGAAASLLVSETAYIAFNVRLVQRRARVADAGFLGFLWKPALATAAMAAAVWFLPSDGVWLRVGAGAAVYAACLTALRGVPLTLGAPAPAAQPA